MSAVRRENTDRAAAAILPLTTKLVDLSTHQSNNKAYLGVYEGFD